MRVHVLFIHLGLMEKYGLTQKYQINKGVFLNVLLVSNWRIMVQMVIREAAVLC